MSINWICGTLKFALLLLTIILNYGCKGDHRQAIHSSTEGGDGLQEELVGTVTFEEHNGSTTIASAEGSLWFPYVANPTFWSKNSGILMSEGLGKNKIDLLRIDVGMAKAWRLSLEKIPGLSGNQNNTGTGGCIIDNKYFAFIVDNEVIRIDIGTGDSEVILRRPESHRLWGPLRYDSNSGLMTCTGTDDKSHTYLIVFKKDKVDILKSPFVGTERPIANHPHICPIRSEWVMFAHDGSWVRDRIWIWDRSNNKYWPVVRQEKYVEWGHQIWSESSEKIYAVQYGSPTRGIPAAVVVIDPHAGEHRKVAESEEYYYSHLDVNEEAGVIAVDTYRPASDGKLYVLVMSIDGAKTYWQTPVEMMDHPFHPHPSWIEDSRTLMYNSYDKAKGSSSVIIRSFDEFFVE